MSCIQRRSQARRLVQVDVPGIDSPIVNIDIERGCLRIDSFERGGVDPVPRHRHALVVRHRGIARMSHIAGIRFVSTRWSVRVHIKQMRSRMSHIRSPHQLLPEYRRPAQANINRNLRKRVRTTAVINRGRRSIVSRPHTVDIRLEGRHSPVGALVDRRCIEKNVAVSIEEVVRDVHPAQFKLGQLRQLLNPARVEVTQRVVPNV